MADNNSSTKDTTRFQIHTNCKYNNTNENSKYLSGYNTDWLNKVVSKEDIQVMDICNLQNTRNILNIGEDDDAVLDMIISLISSKPEKFSFKGGFNKVFKINDDIVFRLFSPNKEQNNTQENKEDEYISGFYQSIISQKCEYVPKVLALGLYDDSPFQLMQYTGLNYKQVLKNNDQNFCNSIHTIKHIANTLKCMHSKGYAHGDIKPENITIKNENTYVIDFGGVATENNALKRDIVATDGYIPSQSIINNELSIQLRKQLDMYAFGMVIVELLRPSLAKEYHKTVTQFLNSKYDYWPFVEIIDKIIEKNTKLNLKLKPEKLIDNQQEGQKKQKQNNNNKEYNMKCVDPELKLWDYVLNTMLYVTYDDNENIKLLDDNTIENFLKQEFMQDNVIEAAIQYTPQSNTGGKRSRRRKTKRRNRKRSKKGKSKRRSSRR